MNDYMGEYRCRNKADVKSNLIKLFDGWLQLSNLKEPILTVDLVLPDFYRGKWKIKISRNVDQSQQELVEFAYEFYDKATIVGLVQASDPVLSDQQRENMEYNYGEGTFDSDNPYKEMPAPESGGANIGEPVLVHAVGYGFSTERNQRIINFALIAAQDFRSFSRDVQYNGKQARIEMTKI